VEVHPAPLEELILACLFAPTTNRSYQARLLSSLEL
jgi:hypothetical protein